VGEDANEADEPMAIEDDSRGVGELLILLLGTPIEEIGGVKGDAKEIGGYETELGGPDADDADDCAIERGHNPTLPKLLAEEDGAQDGQNTGEIIESNHVQQT
jgi:hypothetical protein